MRGSSLSHGPISDGREDGWGGCGSRAAIAARPPVHQHMIAPKGEESGGVVDDDARVGAPDVDGGVLDVADVAPLDGP